MLDSLDNYHDQASSENAEWLICLAIPVPFLILSDKHDMKNN